MRKFLPMLNVQVQVANTSQVRVGFCCPFYPAHGTVPSMRATCAQRQRWPWSVSSPWDLTAIIHQRLTEHLINSITLPHPFTEGITNGLGVTK